MVYRNESFFFSIYWRKIVMIMFFFEDFFWVFIFWVDLKKGLYFLYFLECCVDYWMRLGYLFLWNYSVLGVIFFKDFIIVLFVVLVFYRIIWDIFDREKMLYIFWGNFYFYFLIVNDDVYKFVRC